MSPRRSKRIAQKQETPMPIPPTIAVHREPTNQSKSAPAPQSNKLIAQKPLQKATNVTNLSTRRKLVKCSKPTPTIFPNRPLPPRSPLLELPAELRNWIYELALLRNGGDKETVTKENFAQPSLLRTCRQIRLEAGPMFYLINKFRFRLFSFDTSMWRAHWQQARKVLNAAKMSAMKAKLCGRYFSSSTPEDARNWANVLQFLEWYRTGQIPSFNTVCDKTCRCSKCAVSAANEIVRETVDLPWSTVLRLLEIHRKATEPKRGLDWAWK